MPFFDDSGPQPEHEHSPLWRAITLIGERPEQMIALNVLWSGQSAPLLLAWAFPEWPWSLRIVLTFYTALAFAPASAVLLDLLAHLTQGEPVDWYDVRSALSRHWLTSFQTLLPLTSLFVASFWLITWFDAQEWLIAAILARLSVLMLAVVSVHWGGLYLEQATVWGIVRTSFQRFWRRPGQTLGIALVSALAAALGIVSVAGFLLIVPVFIALMQIELARSFRTRKRDRGLT